MQIDLDIGGRSLPALLKMMRFDAQTYFDRNPDLAVGGIDWVIDHYAQFGMAEGREPYFDLTVAFMQRMLDWIAVSPDERVWLERLFALGIQARLDPSFADFHWLWDMLAPTTSYRPILVIGDSHAHFFRQEPFLRRGVLPALMIGSGVSARGLINPRSRAGFGARLMDVLTRLVESGRTAPLVLKFGQVDIEFVYNFRRIGRKQIRFDRDDADRYADETVEAYAQFLEKCRNIWPAPIIVMSTFPPCLVDSALQEGYINGHVGLLNSNRDIASLSAELRKLQLPDLRTRTAIHRRFNTALRGQCERLGLDFLDEFDAILGPRGIVADSFIAEHRGTDHHLSWRSEAAQSRMMAVADMVIEMADGAEARRVAKATQGPDGTKARRKPVPRAKPALATPDQATSPTAGPKTGDAAASAIGSPAIADTRVRPEAGPARADDVSPDAPPALAGKRKRGKRPVKAA